VHFAHWAGITDVRAYAVPAVLELVAVAFLLIGYRRARRGDSPSALWLLATAVGGFAIYTNVVHTGGRSGLVFGAASAVTLLLWFVKLRDDYRHFQRETGRATRPRPKLGALWLVAPRLSTRAWVLAARRRISTVDEAVGYAEVWRAVYEDARTANVRRRLSRRTAWRSVAEAAGTVWAELPRTAEVAAVKLITRPSPRDRPGPPGPARPPVPAGPAGPPDPARHARGAGTELAVRADAGTVNDGGNGALLRSRVHDFLDARFGLEDLPTDDDVDDPYRLWMTARALGVSVDAAAPHVREWSTRVADRGWHGSGLRS
jgi:hypothetical protein